MPHPIGVNLPPAIAGQLSVCQNGKPSEPERCNVLLVEPAMIPRSDKERLMTGANYCVTTVHDPRGMLFPRFDKQVGVAVLNDLLGPVGLRSAAESVRRQWPFARIVVIGSAVPALEDNLYDETVGHGCEESGFLDLLQRITRNFLGQRWAAVAIHESDPSKNIGPAPEQAMKSSGLPGGLYRMRAAG